MPMLKQSTDHLFKKTSIFILSRSMRNYSDLEDIMPRLPFLSLLGRSVHLWAFNYSACCDPKRIKIAAKVFFKVSRIDLTMVIREN